ncbi:MAG: GAF domain-containing protein [Proteobacteria bacterium]|nr:GAF domain-containing protein [Pseudomonadota bacterium]
MKQMSERKFKLREYKAISHAISTYEDLNLLLQHLVEGICRTFGIKGSSILMYDESEKQLFRISSCGLSDEYLGKGAMYMDDEFNEFLQGKTLMFDNLKNDKRIKYAEAAAKEGIDFIISIPIKYRSTVLGLLKIYHSENLTPHEEDLDSFNVLMKQLGLVIEINGMRHFIGNVKAAMENLPLHVTEGS